MPTWILILGFLGIVTAFIIYGAIFQGYEKRVVGDGPFFNDVDTTDESKALYSEIVGARLGAVSYTSPFVKVLVFNDHITIKYQIDSTIVFKRNDIVSISMKSLGKVHIKHNKKNTWKGIKLITSVRLYQELKKLESND